jgi:LPS-assembly lipoprotein
VGTRIRRLGWLLAAAMLLAACGFHLREAKPLHFKSLYLQANDNDPFAIALIDNLSGNPGLTLTTRRDDAEVTLQILLAQRERQILSLSTAGKVRELTLRERVRFQVLDAKGELLTGPTDLVVDRVLSYNDPNALSKTTEESQIYIELQADTIRLLLLRLATIDPAKKDEH